MAFHLALKAGSHPWASLGIWNHHFVAQSGKCLIKQPTPHGSLQEEGCKTHAGRIQGKFVQIVTFLSRLLKFKLKTLIH